ncbi:MAG: universal stress protein [Planctomycetia bacterium]|nr:universal stress protein [Planctomycetia bacterium]
MTPTVRRVLVALDASASSRAALEAAARWARRGDGEVVALFVEDEDLLRLAAWPRALAFPGRGGAPCLLDPVAMGRELRAAADRARRLAEEVTARTRVRVRFEWTRGRVVPSIVEAAREAELVVLGRRARPTARTALGATASAVAAALPAVLLLDEGETLEPPVVVVVDGSDAGRAALAFADALARRLDGGGGNGLRIVVLPDAEGRPDPAADAAVAARTAGPTPPTVHVARRRDPASVAVTARWLGARTTVLPRSVVAGPAAGAWLASAPGAVVVVDAPATSRDA